MPGCKNIGEPCFDKNASRALKGIAILLMMLHHNFRAVELFEKYSVSFFPFREQQVINIALSCKICVSIFAFISGYGLFLSCQNSKTNASSWTAKRYIRTFSGYWFVWIASSIISQIIDGRATRILCSGNMSQSVAYTIIDFLGLHNLFSTPSVNGTWWYMSAAAVFILLAPILYKYRNNLWLILFIPCVFIRITHNSGTSAFTGGNSVYAFLTPFILGAIFANYHYFEKWCSIGSGRISSKIYKCIAEIYYLAIYFPNYWQLPDPADVDRDAYEDLLSDARHAGNDSGMKPVNDFLHKFIQILEIYNKKGVDDDAYRIVVDNYLSKLPDR